MLSDTPPERDIEWTDAGAAGAWRFTQRLWRMANEAAALAVGAAHEDSGKPLRQITHRTVAAVTDDLMNLRFNRAIARLYELSNAVGSALQSSERSSDEVRCLAGSLRRWCCSSHR